MTVIVAGGVDPSGGAGILRDVAVAAALGVRAYAVGTGWTEQAAGVHQVDPRDPATVSAALARAVSDLAPTAVKIGMAVGPPTAGALVAGLAGFGGPVVVDPVLATSRGGSLWEGEPQALIPLLRRATLVTPNAIEAATLTRRAVTCVADAEAAGRALLEQGVPAALIKGGHLPGDGPLIDLLVMPAGVHRFVHPRLAGASPRGTGCALATAIAVELGRGRSLEGAIARATVWLAGAIAAARPAGGEWHLGC